VSFGKFFGHQKLSNFSAPPKKVEDEPKVPGIGVGIDYQTLGNLDKNIFVKGQKQKDAGKAKKTPSVPAAAAKAPAGVEEAVQKEGLAAGGDYQTMADIDQVFFLIFKVYWFLEDKGGKKSFCDIFSVCHWKTSKISQKHFFPHFF